MFAELHLPDEMTVDRDELEDAVIEAFGGLADMTGAGSGNFGSNLDVEFGDPASRDDIVGTVKTVLASLGVERARVRFEGSEEWISL